MTIGRSLNRVPATLLTESLPFDPANPRAALAELPHSAAVFAL